VPVQRIGKMTLNRNPDNFFAETEQVAFHVGNVVPGIDFTNDPLMQGRLFSYTDTQLIRLGGPNFHEIPINRPIAPVHNNQRDGFMRQTINKGKTSYNPNSLGRGCPFQAKAMEGGFTSHAEKIDAKKIRERSPSFFDHFSQARLFFNSQSDAEKNHIIDALRFELGKVQAIPVRERMLVILANIDKHLASEVAYGLGLSIPKQIDGTLNQSIPADAEPSSYESVNKNASIATSSALSMANTLKDSIQTRKIAFLTADGFNDDSLLTVKKELEENGAIVEVIAPQLGTITGDEGTEIPGKQSFLTAASVFYDAVYVPGGSNSVATLAADPNAVHFLNEAFKHCKAIACHEDARQVLEETYFRKKLPPGDYLDNEAAEGIVIHEDMKQLAEAFVKAIMQHRFWERENHRKVPA